MSKICYGDRVKLTIDGELMKLSNSSMDDGEVLDLEFDGEEESIFKILNPGNEDNGERIREGDEIVFLLSLDDYEGDVVFYFDPKYRRLSKNPRRVIIANDAVYWGRAQFKDVLGRFELSPWNTLYVDEPKASISTSDVMGTVIVIVFILIAMLMVFLSSGGARSHNMLTAGPRPLLIQ